jgi:hypothetical protein
VTFTEGCGETNIPINKAVCVCTQKRNQYHPTFRLNSPPSSKNKKRTKKAEGPGSAA